MFSIQLWNWQYRLGNKSFFAIIFSLGILFIILPIILNLYQLQKEINKHWIHDMDNKEALSVWIQSNIKFLYLFSIFTGSSFTAIEFCNSGLFGLYHFNMGLNKRQLLIFRNKRLYSIILFENIPQLIIQIIYVLYNFNKVTFISILASCFSLISILTNLMEYFIQKTLLLDETLCIIKLEIYCDKISNLTNKLFQINIVNKRNKFENELSKILKVNIFFVELLPPIQTNYGLDLIFHVRSNLIYKQINNIQKQIQNQTNKKGFGKVMYYVIFVFFCLFCCFV